MENTDNNNAIGPHTTLEVERDGETETVSILVPQCCREGWPSCVHVVRRPPPARRNVGL